MGARAITTLSRGDLYLRRLAKTGESNFLNAASPISIQAELLGASRTSPIHALLRHLEGGAKPIGLLIAFGEVAIGLGTLLGLWTRVAAVAGLIISLSLFLTVSYHSSPYFTGSDIVFFFAWIPFIIAGGGTRLSLDAFIAKRSLNKPVRRRRSSWRFRSLPSRPFAVTSTTVTATHERDWIVTRRFVRCCSVIAHH